jgi:DNA polymerase I-like protein with 3'-5' exonuclease and polymerase domains
MSNILTLDCETTTFQKGNPFSRRNKLCYVGILDEEGYRDYNIEYSINPYGDSLKDIERRILKADLIVGFNLKFDLHWIKRYVPTLDFRYSVWDSQLAEFILSHQRQPYPNLGETGLRYGLGGKLDGISSTYWEAGVDTPDVPEDALRDYLRRDVLLTYEVFLKQRELLKENQLKLFKLQCVDLLVLQEMEFNGMLFDSVEAQRLSVETKKKLEDIDAHLKDLVDEPDLNWNSDDVVSAILYGGLVSIPSRVPTKRVLKDGTVKVGEKNGYRYVEFPRLVEPLPNTETKPTNQWSDDELAEKNVGRIKPFVRVYQVGEPILKSLKAKGKADRIIALILERSKLEKLNSTYYEGLSNIIVEKDWPENTIHGQFNQCVAVTGRLSSSSPNQQNFAGEIKTLFYSRYNNND